MADVNIYTNTNETCLDSFGNGLLEALKPFMECSTPSSSVWFHPEPSFYDLLWSFPSSDHMDTALIGLNSSEIDQALPSVQGESTAIHSLGQMSNNVASAQVDEYWLGPFNSKEIAQLDASFRQPTQQLLIEIEKDTNEMLQFDSHFPHPNVETHDQMEHTDIATAGIRELFNGESNLVNGATTNIKTIIDSQENKAIERIVKDYGITREILEQHFGMTIDDAAKALHVSRSTLKRIRKEYGISRWPHHKTRKVSHHVSQERSLECVEAYVGDQQCSDLSQEKGADHLVHKMSPANSVMTVEVTSGSDFIQFDLSPSLTRVELEEEVEKRLNVQLQSFSIKYLDTDEVWILIESDSDLRDGVHSLRLSGRTTMKLLITLKSNHS